MTKRFGLKSNLQLFSADLGGGAGQTDPNNAGGQTDPNAQGSGQTDPNQQSNGQQQQQQEHMIPKSRFDEVNNTVKTLQAELDKINKAKEQAELENKKEQGKFEELYSNASAELETVKGQATTSIERVGQLETIIQTLVDAELEAVPEDMRDLVPDNMTPEQKLSWITNAKSKGLFGATQNHKQHEELGGSTNNQQQQQVDVSKMSITDLFKSAYGKK